MADEDYKGRSGAASYSARKTYRSSPRITNKKQYKDKSIGLTKAASRPTEMFEVAASPKEKEKYEKLPNNLKEVQNYILEKI